jgi:hypothetical protein
MRAHSAAAMAASAALLLVASSSSAAHAPPASAAEDELLPLVPPTPSLIAGWVVTKDSDALPHNPGPCWQSLSETANAAACAAKCNNGSIFVWHHPPPAHCHCCTSDCLQKPVYTATPNKRVDSGCRPTVSGCEKSPPAPPPPPVPLDPKLPTWTGALPNPSLPNHGLQLMANRRRVTVYNSTTPTGANNSNGLYNHGPMVVFFEGVFLCSWYNAPLRESQNMRVLMSSSVDALSWSEPQVVFPALDAHGGECGPFSASVLFEHIQNRIFAKTGSGPA